MGSTQHSQAKANVTPAAAPPQVSPLQSRGFGEQADAQLETESSFESSTPLQARLDRASRLGHNFNNVQVISQAPAVQRQEAESEEEETAMMKPELQMAGGAADADPELESSIQSARGGGQPLDSGIRRSMEGAFGADFSGVRVHTDSQADTLNRSIHAQAFTTGQDVFFRSGSYDPGSSGGKELLAHELTHVVQQSGGQVSRPQGKLTIGQPGDQYEQEADATAAQVVQRIEAGEQAQRKVDATPQAQQPPMIQTQLVPKIQMQQGPQQQGSARRPLPPGTAQIISIDAGQVIAAFDTLWNDAGFSMFHDSVSGVPASLSSHPELPDRIRQICGSTHFTSSNYYSTDWMDDGHGLDLLWIGDADVKAEMTVYVQNEQDLHSGDGSYSSQATSTNSQTDSNSTTTSVGAQAGAGGHEGAPGGQVNAGVSNTTGTSATMTTSGQGGISMTAPVVQRQAEVVIQIRLSMKPSIGGAPGLVTREMFTDVVGSIVMGAAQ